MMIRADCLHLHRGDLHSVEAQLASRVWWQAVLERLQHKRSGEVGEAQHTRVATNASRIHSYAHVL